MALPGSALTTLATVLGELSLTSDAGPQDAALERMIMAASDRIARHCNRTFERADDIVERVKPRGEPRISLQRTPILSVASAVYRGVEIGGADYEVDSAAAGLVFRSGGWPWSVAAYPSLTYPPYAGSEAPVLVVTYAAGWVTPQQVALGAFTPRTLPYDLEDACVQLVTQRWLRKGTDPRVVSESLDAYSVTYEGADGHDGLPASVRATLAPYRRLVHA